MELHDFKFTGVIQGKHRQFTVKAPIGNGNVCTNKFCPQELLTGGLSIITAINGETLSEFIADCTMQVKGMEATGYQDSLFDVHIAGLMGAVMNHLSRCGRLIFGDLLIYMDCFSLLLEADGFSETEIREVYPQVTRTIVKLYPDYVFNTADLSPFKGSHFDIVLENTCRTAREMKKRSSAVQ